MRRVDLSRDVVAAVPAGAYVEVVGDPAQDSTRPQWLPASVLGTSAAATVNTDRIAVLVDGNNLGVIATVDGLTTGLIDETATSVDITSSVSTKIITLPDGQGHGKIFYLYCIANGVDVVSANAADDLNGTIIGITNGAPLTATVMYTLIYDGFLGNWICTGLTQAGVVETPITPVAL